MSCIEVGQSDLINELYNNNYKAIIEVTQSTMSLFLAKIL